jgi:surface antigen
MNTEKHIPVAPKQESSFWGRTHVETKCGKVVVNEPYRVGHQMSEVTCPQCRETVKN